MKVVRSLLIASLMLAHLPAHAASFDCHRGQSLTEQMICHDPALSKLDDTLGQLYWKARRRVINRRAFLIDSDSKWAWRETNCRDAACLGTWYATRIEELQWLIDSMREGESGTSTNTSIAPRLPATELSPAGPAGQRNPLLAAVHPAEPAPLQCTAANPGPINNEQCSTVLRQTGSRWKYPPHSGDWFCGVAMLAQPQPAAQTQTQTQANASQ
jgi:hypothetical protein